MGSATRFADPADDQVVFDFRRLLMGWCKKGWMFAPERYRAPVPNVRLLAVGVACSMTLAGLGGCAEQIPVAATATEAASAELTATPTVDCQAEAQTGAAITIATGPAGGAYQALGSALAEVLTSSTWGDVRARPVATDSAVQNIRGLVAGGYQVAFAPADLAAAAVKGRAPFGARQPIEALARAHADYTQVVVRSAAGIGSVADLRGKRVSTGPADSATEVIARRVLTAGALDPDSDVRARHLGLSEAVAAMKSATLDAMIWSGAMPTPEIASLFATPGSKVALLDLGYPVLQKVMATDPAYTDANILAGYYVPAETSGTGDDPAAEPAEVRTLVLRNLLIARDDLDPGLGCLITSTLFNRQPDLEATTPVAKDLTLDFGHRTGPVPLNRGGDQALRDLGSFAEPVARQVPANPSPRSP
jgi:TRAP transporter TAXI family solute receptor